MAELRQCDDDDATPLRVFLVDDHQAVRRSIRDLLETWGGFDVVGEDASAVTAVPEILSAAPDVAVVDLRLDDGSGGEVCRAVHAANGGIATLVLTAGDDDLAVLAVVLAGASGHVLKVVRGAHLVAAIREAAAGRLVDPDDRARVIDEVHRRQHLDQMLTAAQVRVLDLLVAGGSDTEIAQRLRVDPSDAALLVSTLIDTLGLSGRRPVDSVLSHLGADDHRDHPTSGPRVRPRSWTGAAVARLQPGAMSAQL